MVVPLVGSARLRLSLDQAGRRLVPTHAERAEAERGRAEAAEAELVRLRAELAALRG